MLGNYHEQQLSTQDPLTVGDSKILLPSLQLFSQPPPNLSVNFFSLLTNQI